MVQDFLCQQTLSRDYVAFSGSRAFSASSSALGYGGIPVHMLVAQN